MIYFAQSVVGGPIKVGTTYDLGQRVKSLGRAFSGPFRVLAVMDGGYIEEKAIHGRFVNLRIAGNGRELFEPGPSLLQFIAENGKSWSPKKKMITVAVGPGDDPNEKILPCRIQPGRPGRPKLGPEKGKTTNVHIRTSPPLKAWLGRFATAEGSTISALLIEAARWMAKRKKFEPPPEG